MKNWRVEINTFVSACYGAFSRNFNCINISRAPIDEGFQQEVVVAGDNVVTADGLAVDWIYHHLYWTDTGTNTINMANLAGLAKNQTSFGFIFAKNISSFFGRYYSRSSSVAS